MKTVKYIYRGGGVVIITLCLIAVFASASRIDAQEKWKRMAGNDLPTIPTPSPLPDLSAFAVPDDLDHPTIDATFTVNDLGDAADADLTDTLCDSGAVTEGSQCTLRAAIEQANVTPAKDKIAFNVTGDLPFIIDPDTLLPVITHPVVIDATTQPGYVDEPLIQIDATELTHGLALTANHNAIIGLKVANATEVNIQLAGANNMVKGCQIVNGGGGGAGYYLGVGIGVQGAENTIGGTASGDGNFIAANGRGILVEGASAAGNVIQGNEIDGNDTGVSVVLAPDTLIGGSAEGAGNIFTTQNSVALYLSEATNTRILGNEFFGNFIGISATNAAGTRIGGAGTGAGNEFADNIMPIWLTDDQGKTRIYGNVIRFEALLNVSQVQPPDPATDWHRLYGVIIEGGKSIRIGGKQPGKGNQISGHQDGIFASNVTKITIQGNRISTYDIIGMEDTRGIALFTCSDVTIGGTAPGARNVISSSETGISAYDVDQIVIQGSLIGTDETGTAALPNTTGIDLYDSHHILIGGGIPGAGNLISGNDDFGVHIGTSTEIVLQQNLIGTTVTGLAPLGNTGAGVHLVGVDGVTIGGNTALTRNVISANGADGLSIVGGINVTVKGNFIGANRKGKSAAGMGNVGNGILMDGNDFPVNIGGTGKKANRIINNGLAGIRADVFNDAMLTGNRLTGNGGLGIDLGLEGVTPNDPDEADFVQNFPVINFLKRKDGTHLKTRIKGTLNSTPSGTFTLHFYSVKTCDPSGYGEADKYLGQKVVQADETGEATFSVKFPVKLKVGDSVVATATHSGDDTSEFSACFDGTPIPAISDGLRR